MNTIRFKPTISALLMLGLSFCVSAQGIYRVVGSDGKVTFSDKPPANTATNSPTTVASTADSTSGSAALPYELRQTVNKFPVTLYSAPNCTPCANGRTLLQGRGIPFTERTINGATDAAALSRIAGDASVPVMAVGNQRINGYQEQDWSRLLDAAGYPAQSKLPASYRNPPATPLAPALPKNDAASKPSAEPATAPAPVPGPAPSNPAGIQF